MQVTDILSSDQILCNVDVVSKKRALELMSELLCKSSALTDGVLSSQKVFEALINRERLGSTSIGNGVSIPHARMSGLSQVKAVLLRLKSPVDYDALSDRPVDILFGLLVPDDSDEKHLELLTLMAEMFSDAEVCAAIRRSDQAETMLKILMDWVATQQHSTE